MENRDTIHLLKECDAGTKMAVRSIDDVLESVESPELEKLIIETKDHHTKLGNEIHELLIKYDSEEKDPNAMAKGMSWLKTNMKLSMNDGDDDATIADLITDGCDMGIKSLNKYLNQYPNANHKVKDICNRLISIEDELRKEIKKYL